MATIALFSGQGSQYEKMGLDLVQQDAALEEIFEVASEVLGFDLYAVIADSDAQTLAHTIYAQPAIMATSLVCLEAAKKRGFTYDAVAGHSLGEYAAMVAAGMLSLEDGFKVIKARSEAMDAAAKAADGAMCAILKLAPAEVERICSRDRGLCYPGKLQFQRTDRDRRRPGRCGKGSCCLRCAEGKSSAAGCGKRIPHQADAAGCGYLL